MEKEELLQKARKENQHGDERITYLDERSSSLSFRVIMSVLIVYDVVVWLIGPPYTDRYYYLHSFAQIGMFLYNLAQFYYTRKKSNFFFVIIFGVNAVYFLYWLVTGTFLCVVR